ncbi:MAG: hypothetical protein AB7I27_10555 [Bacteriovoracaceae bacterium]
MKISIIGLGYLGLPLAHALKSHYQVLGTKREQISIPGVTVIPLNLNTTPEAQLMDADVIVLNIPPFDGQLEWFKSWKWTKKSKVIFISSTSVYQESEGLVSESCPRNDNLLKWEEDWIQNEFNDWVILRMGGLIGNGRHPLNFLLKKKNLPHQDWPVNLIHQDDAVGAIRAVIEKKINREILNVVSDEHSKRKDFYTGADFDPHDHSTGKIIDNSKLKNIYQLKWPTMLGKAL